MKLKKRQLTDIILVLFVSCCFSYHLFSQNVQPDRVKAEKQLKKAEELAKNKHYTASTDFALQAGKEFEKLKDWEKWHKAYRIIFLNAIYSGSFAYSIALLEEGLNKILPKDQLAIKGKLQSYLGYSYDGIGDLFSSIIAYEKSIVSLTAVKDSTGLIKAYGNLGMEYIQLADYSKAVDYIDKGLSLGRHMKDIITFWKNTKLLGDAYFYKGDFKQAQKIYDEAQKLIDPKDGTFERYKAKVAYALGNYAVAIEAVEQGMELSKKQGRPDILIELEKLLGEIYLTSGKSKRAIAQFQKILPDYEKSSNKRELGKLYILIGNAYKSIKAYDKALKVYQKSLQAFLPRFTNDSPTVNPKEEEANLEIWLMEVFKNKGDCFLGKYKETENMKLFFLARENYELAQRFTEKTKLNYSEIASKYTHTDNTYHFFEDVVKMNLELYGLSKKTVYKEEAFMAIQKANALVLRELLNEKKAMEIVGVPKDTVRLLTNYQKHIDILGREMMGSPGTVFDSLKNVRFDLKQKQGSLKNAISKKYPKFNQLRNDLKGVTIQEIQKRIDSTTVFLKYAVGARTLYIFSVTDKEFHIDTIALPKNFNKLVGRYRQAISDQRLIDGKDYDYRDTVEKQYLNSAHELYKLILEKPLSRYSAKRSIDQLSIVADGALHTIPFQALLYRESDSWATPENMLISKYAIHYHYFSKMLAAPKEKPVDHDRFMSFGLKDFDGTDLAKLPSAVDEANDLAALMGGKSYVNKEATKSSFLKKAPYAGIIHITTHAVSYGNNANSYSLVFAKTKDAPDHLLHTEDIYNLELNATMAALSACDAAYGVNRKGEGINSLARAFNFSGIPSITATLWSVPAKSSKEIMKLYYEYLKQGYRKSRALQKAQLEYLENDEFSGPSLRLPVYWASWMIVGNNDPIPEMKGSSVFSYVLLFSFLFWTVLFLFLMRKSIFK